MSSETARIVLPHGRRRKLGARGDARFALWMIAPATLFMLAFVGVSVIRLVIDSFYDIQPIAGTREFVGLGNYIAALSSSAFQQDALRTVLFTVGVVAAEFILGLAAALLFNAIGKRSALLRTLFLYPIMIAPLIAGLLWRFLMLDNFGLINELLAQWGIISSPAAFSWLSDPSIVIFAVAIPEIWLTTSFVCLVLYAGMQNIPADILEAAKLDGANAWTTLIRIILPLLRPVIAVVLIIRGVDASRIFDSIFIQSGGGPQSASETLSILIYRYMIGYADPGGASAMSVLYILAMVVVAAIAFRFMWRPGEDR